MWQADFSELRLSGKQLYLFMIIDDLSGVIVGHHLADALKAEVVVRTLREAIAQHGKPEALCTDRGSVFVSKGLRRYLEAEKIDHVVGHCAGPRSGMLEFLFCTVRRELRDTEWRIESLPSALSRSRSLFEQSKGGDNNRKGMGSRHGIESK